MNASRAGFTLIELLIVVAIIGLLAAAFLPDLLQGQQTANAAADQSNLAQHQRWFVDYKRKVKHYPTEGGHKFLLDLWVRQVVNHTPDNFDRFWTPGMRDNDPQWINLRPMVMRREPIWTDLNSLTSLDTHYAARAKEHILTIDGANEAWIANDNEFQWNLGDTVNILYSGAPPTSLSLQQLAEVYGWAGGKEQIFKTFGPDADLPELTKLDK